MRLTQRQRQKLRRARVHGHGNADESPGGLGDLSARWAAAGRGDLRDLAAAVRRGQLDSVAAEHRAGLAAGVASVIRNHAEQSPRRTLAALAVVVAMSEANAVAPDAGGP